MPAPLSQDIRKRVMAALTPGVSMLSVAKRFSISPSAVERLVRRVKETGTTAAAEVGGRRKRVLAGQEAFLREQVAAKPGITLVELQGALAERGVTGSIATIHRMLGHLGLTHKKSASRPRSGAGPRSSNSGTRGGSGNAGSTRYAWCSSTKAA